MTIEFYEDKILVQEGYEKWGGKPLIGYINPQGQLLDYSRLIGEEGHDSWTNPASPVFLSFLSFIIKDTKIDEIQQRFGKEIASYSEYEGFDNIVKRGVDICIDYNDKSYKDFLYLLKKCLSDEQKKAVNYINRHRLWKRDVYEALRYDLIKLFDKLYSNNNFFDSFGRLIYAENKSFVLKKYGIQNGIMNDEECEEFYCCYLIIHLMSYLKDICVQYLGYDSIERGIPNSDLVKRNNMYDKSRGYKFAPNPRTIFTSCCNVNERFYNWLLMDWTIRRVPRYFWNEKEKRFELEQPDYDFHQTDKEEILGKEIEAIKNQIPKDKRKAYFR